MSSAANSQIRDVSALRLFARVARLGSFSAAAREAGLSQSQASRMIAELEADLGARLLARTTRVVTPTEAGAMFLAQIEPVLTALDEAAQSLREDGALRGVLRMSMPGSVALREVIPRLAPFTARHPQLHIQLLLEDRRQDLTREAVDVAIRVGAQRDSSATMRRIAQIPRVIIAAPGYLLQAGHPSHPADLAAHRIIMGPAAAVPSAFRFSRAGEEVSVEVRPVFTVNETEAATAAALAGLGITSTPLWTCRRELAEGRLIRLLPDWETELIPVFAYFPLGRATRAAGRAMADFLAAAWADLDNV
jgi:DNA-binding transcriptional LysR family regulator